MKSIYKRESFSDFLQRVVDLNAVHTGAETLHHELLGTASESAQKSSVDPAAARKKLLTIHNDFPYGTELGEQCAFIIRAFSGLEPFAGADLRTGWDYVSELLEHDNHSLAADQSEIETMGLDLFDRMQDTYPSGFERRNVLDRDDTLEWLSAWFKQRIA